MFRVMCWISPLIAISAGMAFAQHYTQPYSPRPDYGHFHVLEVSYGSVSYQLSFDGDRVAIDMGMDIPLHAVLIFDPQDSVLIILCEDGKGPYGLNYADLSQAYCPNEAECQHYGSAPETSSTSAEASCALPNAASTARAVEFPQTPLASSYFYALDELWKNSDKVFNELAPIADVEHYAIQSLLTEHYMQLASPEAKAAAQEHLAISLRLAEQSPHTPWQDHVRRLEERLGSER